MCASDVSECLIISLLGAVLGFPYFFGEAFYTIDDIF